MVCLEFTERVTEFMEGAMPSGERRRFADHASGCLSCARYLAQMRATVSVLRRLHRDTGDDAR